MNVGEENAIHLRLNVSTFMPSKPSKPAESVSLSTVTLVEESWLEQHFFATEALGANNDDVSVCELEGKRHALANFLEDGRAT